MLKDLIMESLDIQEIIVSKHGAEGLLACTQHTFDLIITDYEMPVMNGLNFLNILRHLQMQNQFVPVIFFTAFVPIVKESAKIYENVYFIDKPIQYKKFLNLISMLIKLPIRKAE